MMLSGSTFSYYISPQKIRLPFSFIWKSLIPLENDIFNILDALDVGTLMGSEGAFLRSGYLKIHCCSVNIFRAPALSGCWGPRVSVSGVLARSTSRGHRCAGRQAASRAEGSDGWWPGSAPGAQGKDVLIQMESHKRPPAEGGAWVKSRKKHNGIINTVKQWQVSLSLSFVPPLKVFQLQEAAPPPRKVKIHSLPRSIQHPY